LNIKNDPMLLMDRRFLMDYLVEKTEDALVLPVEPIRFTYPVRERVLDRAKFYFQYSPRLTAAFINAARSALQSLSMGEFEKWTRAGLDMVAGSDGNIDLVEHFMSSGTVVLSTYELDPYLSWANWGIRISACSPLAAAEFFRLTPDFLKHCDLYQMWKWSDWGIELINGLKGGSDLALSFFGTSVCNMAFMTFRELKDWKRLGFMFSKCSLRLGLAYFSETSDAFKDLFWPERNLIYQLTAVVLEHDPVQALDFFTTCADDLTGISPNDRDKVLHFTGIFSKKRPEAISKEFQSLAASLKGLPFPAQHAVLEELGRLAETSPETARAFYRHAKKILTVIPEIFLGQFVHRGIVLMENGLACALAYFSLESTEAEDELVKWKAAIQLDDYRQILSLFACAMTGKMMPVAEAKARNQARPSPGIYPSTDGETIFLPPFSAGGKTPGENFSDYKAATAHQAGLVEFGAFGFGTGLMISIFSAFDFPELAADIFFILEQGRIDYCLRKHYRGIAEDLDIAVEKGKRLRKPLAALPVREALVEVLLYLTLDILNEDVEVNHPVISLTDPVRHLTLSLSGFYESTTSTWDCFQKALEIYTYIRDFSEPYSKVIGDPAFEENPGNTTDRYFRTPPFSFRGENDRQMFNDPLEMEVRAIEKDDGSEGSPLSPEELQRLIESQNTPMDILKVLDGKKLSGPGIFIKSVDHLVCRAVPGDPGPKVHPPKMGRAALSSIRCDIGPFYYDEWDYLQAAYRKRWCRVFEKEIATEDPASRDDIYGQHHALIQKVKRQFKRIRPDIREIFPRVDQGDEIDLAALVEVLVDKKARSQPSDRIFIRKEKKIRKIAVLLLVDMSASTSDAVFRPDHSLMAEGENPSVSEAKKIIDLEIESIAVMMEALSALDDDFAVFGFSGFGRDRVDFYRIKDFSETYNDDIKRRVGGISPKQSTRMGPAIRHAVSKLVSVESEQRLLILLSDGFPQDNDYGEDRTSYEYGIMDTMMALLEARSKNIRPFCITVDQGANDYMRKMCEPANYLVIRDILSLPAILPRVVESLIR